MNKGIVFTALSGMLYGSIGYFGVRLLNQGLSVLDLLVWRFLFSTLILLPVLFTIKDTFSSINWKALWQLLLLGGILYAASTTCYFSASTLIGTGLAMVIFFSFPIFVALLSFVFNNEPITLTTIASLFLIFIGCVMIALGDEWLIDFKGIMLALMSGIGYGFYVFSSKKSSRLLSPLLATFVVCLGASIAFILYSVLIQQPLYMPATNSVWLHISLFSLLGTVLPVLLLMAGLKYISASKASIISVLEPVTVLCVGSLILGETITTIQLIGAIVILSSALIVQLDKEKAI